MIIFLCIIKYSITAINFVKFDMGYSDKLNSWNTKLRFYYENDKFKLFDVQIFMIKRRKR